MRTIVYIVLMLWQQSQDRPPPHRRKSLKQRRRERELLFWTAREILALGRQTLRFLLLAALVIYAITSLIAGHLPGLDGLIRSL